MTMPRMIRILTPLLLALALLTAPAAAVPVRSAPSELLYVALGDSVPSGTDLSDGVGYPRRLGQHLADASGRPIRLLNRARAREQSAGVLASQLADIRYLQPELVTLTVGANDFLLPAIECAAATLDENPGTQCSGPSLLSAVPAFERNLRAIVQQVVRETGASIVVTTYFNPFPRGSQCAPGLADVSLRFLNSTITDVVAEAGDRAMIVDLAPVFSGHEGREPVGWFSPNPTRIACTDIHPNGDGHEAIAQAIWQSLAPRLALTTN
jgi:lysophospholipase L1-like esterase